MIRMHIVITISIMMVIADTIEDAYRKLGLRSQINTILKPALERSLQRGTHW